MRLEPWFSVLLCSFCWRPSGRSVSWFGHFPRRFGKRACSCRGHSTAVTVACGTGSGVPICYAIMFTLGGIPVGVSGDLLVLQHFVGLELLA